MVKILISSLLSAAQGFNWCIVFRVSYFSFLNLTIILLKGNALKVSESVKTPINSNAC